MTMVFYTCASNPYAYDGPAKQHRYTRSGNHHTGNSCNDCPCQSERSLANTCNQRCACITTEWPALCDTPPARACVHCSCPLPARCGRQPLRCHVHDSNHRYVRCNGGCAPHASTWRHARRAPARCYARIVWHADHARGLSVLSVYLACFRRSGAKPYSCTPRSSRHHCVTACPPGLRRARR